MRILVTGRYGLVGAALQKLQSTTNHDMVFVGRGQFNLTDEKQVEAMFRMIKPDWVIHTAAKVGGIGGNANSPADMFRLNMLMNTHMIHHAWMNDVKKFIGFSSVCVFKEGLSVLKEDLMQEGEPYPTQFAYGMAKRAMDVQIKAYKKQYGEDRQYTSIIPCNIFGTNDYYNLSQGHVIPSLIHKLYLAKNYEMPFKVWGDGSAKREFIYSLDIAKIVLQLLELEKIPQRIIVSRNGEISIKEVVEKLCNVANFRCDVEWQTDKPNGTLSRPTDLTLLNSLIKVEYTDTDEALEDSYRWFEENYPKVRV